MSSILGLCEGLDATAFEPGDVLLGEGTRTGMLYILMEGSVEVLKGDFQIDVVSEPGAFFGEMSALMDTPHMATVRTLLPSRLYRIERGVEFLNNHATAALEVARLLARRLNGVTDYLVDMKDRFEDGKGHSGGMDSALQALIHKQLEHFMPKSDRDPDKSV